MALQQRQVLRAFRKRRNLQFHRGEPEIEIFAELSLAGHLLQVAVSGGHDAHVHFGDRRRTHALDLMVLQNSQQFGLHRQRHFSDFIQHCRSAVGIFEDADLVLIGSSKCSSDVTEELAFGQALRNGGAIDSDEALSRAAQLMQGLGHEFLARSRGTRYENTTEMRRDAPNLCEEIQH